MAEKEKNKPPQSKHIPKDGQVILSIMKEMGITEYEPKILVQLTEFVYRYATSILEEARSYANSKKRVLDLDDVRLALILSSESTFTMPPSRETVLECARNKNSTPLPLIKLHCGLRLPPDRHCLAACNYTLKSAQKKKNNFTMSGGAPTLKLSTKPGLSYIKRSNPIGATKQAVTVPKPVTKITSGLPQKTVIKPKIQIQQSVQIPSPSPSNNSGDIPMEVENSLKRKREDEGEEI